jgi:hypothetical protein
VAPLAFMRGRTLNDSFVILDEAQNTSPEQMQMFLTRLGYGSKMVVTGDVTQVDLPREQASGLIQVREILSTVDGMLTASSTMFSKDIYLRILRPSAGDSELKRVARITEGLTLLATIALFPIIVKSQSVMTFIQNFYGDVLGVVVALYLSGIFSTRTTPRAGFIALVSGVAFAVALDIFTPINFTYVGFFSFLYTLGAALLLSRLEPALAPERLVNLTIYSLPDARGPWVGLKSWPDLWKWALFMAALWFSFSIGWEWFVTR